MKRPSAAQARRLRRFARGLAVGATAAAAVLLLRRTALMRAAELGTFDALTHTFADPALASKDIVVAAIDDQSLNELAPAVGRWPWPRAVHAEALDYLVKYSGARLVVYDVQFPDPDRIAGSDEQFAASLAENGKAVLPVALTDGGHGDQVVVGAATGEAELSRFAVPVRAAPPAHDFGLAISPRPEFARAAAGIGSIALNADTVGGAVYGERLLWRHAGRAYPSLAFQAARLLDPRRYGGPVTADRHALGAGTATVPLDDGQMLLRWRGPMFDGRKQTWPVYAYSRVVLSYEDVFHGRPPAIPPDVFRGKIVVVAVTASGMDVRQTPLGAQPGAIIHLTALDNLLRGDFLRRAPEWANVGMVIVAALAAAAAATVIGSAIGGTAATLVILLLAGGGAALSFRSGLWLEAAAPALAGAVAYAGTMAANYVREGRDRKRVRGLMSRYVNPEIVRQLADESRDLMLGGQRVPLTILFSDIRGFTSLSEKLPAEGVVAMLNEYLGAMTEIVFAHGGTLDKFIGDAVMALWGAPLPVADHARRAADCALAMTAELERLNARWSQSGEGAAGLRIGIGVNTGEAVVGNIGSLKHKLEYTAIGDAVNLASRLEGLNKEMGTTIIISEATRAALGEGFDTAPLREVNVKGKEQAVLVHELRGHVRAPVSAVPRAAAAVTAALLLALLPQHANAQAKQRWSDRIYQPGTWRGGQVAPWATTNAATDSLALVAEVTGYAKAPRWRMEISRVGANGQRAEPLVLVAERNRVTVVTGVANAPLEQNAAKDDPVVQAVVAQFDASGALKQPGAGRIVQRAADRKVTRVIVRRPSVQNDFPESLLAMSSRRRALNDIVQRGTGRVAENRSQNFAATAGARGVTRSVDTPRGRISVVTNDAAVAAMDARTVDVVAVDAFLRNGHLEAPVPVKEETSQ